MKRLPTLLAVLLVALPPQASAWKLAEPGVPYSSEKLGYSIEFPAGWRYDAGLFAGRTIATLDGPNLAVAYVEFRKHANAFKAIKKSSSPDVLPQDLGQEYVANLQQDRGIENLAVPSDEPVELAGLPAFRTHISYRFVVDKGAVRYEEIVVGAAHERGLFVVGYRAPVLHYFGRYRDDFERALATFAIQELATKKR